MTIEEIKTEAEKTPALKTAIFSSFKEDFQKSMEAEGVVIRTKEQDQAYVDAQLKSSVDTKVAEQLKSKVGEEFAKSMNQIDAEIKSITGIEKNNGEKTTDYAKRAVSELKSKGGDAATKERVAQLEKMVADTKTEFETKLAAEKETSFKRENEFLVTTALDKVNVAIPVHLKTDAEKQEYVNRQKALIRADFINSHKSERDSDGNITYKAGDAPLLNSKDGKPKSAADIIGEKYSAWFVPGQHIATGTGTGQQGGAGSGFKTSDDVHKHLKTQGVEAGSPEYLEQFEKLTTDNKISV